MSDEKVNLEVLWESCLEKTFNVFTVGKIFRLSKDCLVVGGEDGIIIVYEIPCTGKISAKKVSLKELIKLETKGGPVQALCLRDVTKFGSVDLIVADSKGMLTFFGNEQILYKMAISEARISTLAVDIDAAQNLEIVVGDHEGNVVGCLPHCTQWKLRLNDVIMANKDVTEVTVTALLSIKLPISLSLVSNYVLVADSNKNMHVLQNGSVVRSLSLPSVVNTMCAGYFLGSLDTSNPLSPPSNVIPKSGIPHQVALGMENGQIYILNNFTLTLYADIKLPLTRVIAFSLGGAFDTLVCCGYFNSILIYCNGALLHKVATSDWVSSIAVTSSETSQDQCVYLSTLDNRIQCYKINKTRS